MSSVEMSLNLCLNEAGLLEEAQRKAAEAGTTVLGLLRDFLQPHAEASATRQESTSERVLREFAALSPEEKHRQICEEYAQWKSSADSEEELDPWEVREACRD